MTLERSWLIDGTNPKVKVYLRPGTDLTGYTLSNEISPFEDFRTIVTTLSGTAVKLLSPSLIEWEYPRFGMEDLYDNFYRVLAKKDGSPTLILDRGKLIGPDTGDAIAARRRREGGYYALRSTR